MRHLYVATGDWGKSYYAAADDEEAILLAKDDPFASKGFRAIGQVDDDYVFKIDMEDGLGPRLMTAEEIADQVNRGFVFGTIGGSGPDPIEV